MSGRIIRISPIAMRRRVLAAVMPVGTERISIESARGRVLAEQVRARHPSPEMDCSVMDGYAMNHKSLVNASRSRPVCLKVAGEIGAGQSSRHRLPRGQAIRIMTGAPLPPGTDCVVPLEETRIDLDQILIFAQVPKLKFVRTAGSELKRKQLVLTQGTTIGPAEMAMLAFLDRPLVKVYRRPRVGVISTGDELGAVGQKRPYGHIPDSNRYALLGLIESAGCEPVDGGRVGDEPKTLWRRLIALRPKVDFIITSGGVSAGDRDVVKLLMATKGNVDLYRLPMKPGKPQAFGRFGRIPFFGLPGNPVSAMVVFDLLVRPALRKMAGAVQLDTPQFLATVMRDLPPKTRNWEFPRVIAREKNGNWQVYPVKSQRSSDLKSMTDADGYVILPPKSPAARKGTKVLFMPLVR